MKPTPGILPLLAVSGSRVGPDRLSALQTSRYFSVSLATSRYSSAGLGQSFLNPVSGSGQSVFTSVSWAAALVLLLQ